LPSANGARHLTFEIARDRRPGGAIALEAREERHSLSSRRSSLLADYLQLAALKALESRRRSRAAIDRRCLRTR